MGTGTLERVCGDVGLESQVPTHTTVIGRGGPKQAFRDALAVGRKRPPERTGELARRLMPDKCPGGGPIS